MSKNLLYSYKRWYEIEKTDKNNKPYKVKIKLVRRYKDEYKIVRSDKVSVDNLEFLEQYENYSKKNIKKINDNMQILFTINKLEINDVVILRIRKDKKIKSSRKEIEKNLNNVNNLVSGSDNLQVKVAKKIQQEKFTLYDCAEEYDNEISNNSKDNIILFENQSSIKVEKVEIKTLMEQINGLLKSLLFEIYNEYKSLDKLEESTWKEQLKEFINKSSYSMQIVGKFAEIRNKINDNEKLLNFTCFNIKNSKNQNDLYDKIGAYLEIYFDSNENFDSKYLINFVVNFSKQYMDFYKRSKLGNKDLENTYVSNDKHVYFNKGIEIEKSRNKAMRNLVLKIKEDRNYVDKTFEELYKKIYSDNFKSIFGDKNIEVNNQLFIKYKEYYKKRFNEEVIKSYSYEKRLILRYVYLFFKGRIRKWVKNPKMKYEDIFRNNLKEKCKKDLINKILEFILYNGKLEMYNIKPNTNEFQKIHALEELFNETMLGLWNLNYKFEGIRTKGDFLGDSFISDKNKNKEDEINNLEALDSEKLRLLQELNMLSSEEEIQDEFFKVFNLLYEFRSKLIHGGNIFINERFKKLEYNKDNLKKYLKCMYTKSFEKNIIALNLEENLTKKQLEKITSGEFEEEKINFFPSSNKIVNSLKSKIEIEGYDYTSSRYKEFENVGKFLIKLIYEKNLYRDNIKDGSFLSYLKNLNKVKKDIDIIDFYSNKYKVAQSSESKGKKGSIAKFQGEIVQNFVDYYCKDDNFSILLKFKDNQDKLTLEEIIGKLKNNQSVKMKDKDDVITYIYTLLALFVDNDKVNVLKNRINSTIVWLETIDENANELEILKRIYNNYNIISEINDYEYSHVTSIMENNKIAEEINKVLEGKVLNLGEDIERSLKEDTINISKEEIIKILTKKGYQKEISNVLKVYNEDIKPLQEQKVKLDSYYQYLEQYKEEKYINIYYQEDLKSEIFRKGVYNYTNLIDEYKDEIDKILKGKKCLVQDLDKEELEKFKNSKQMEEQILKVDKSLTELNKVLKSREKDRTVIKYIKGKGFEKLLSNTKYKTFDEFEKDYNEVVEYKKIKNIINHNIQNDFYNLINKINWRYGQFIVLIERDLNMFVLGMKRLGIININKDEVDEEKTSPVIGKRYKLSDYSKKVYFEFSNLLGMDVILNDYDKKGKNSIRNYISHAYMIRNPFEKSLIEIGKELEILLSYRTRYNRAVKVSLLNILKEDIKIDYKKLNQYFEFENISNNYYEKKVSKLELSSYKNEYKNIVDKFLKYEI